MNITIRWINMRDFAGPRHYHGSEFNSSIRSTKPRLLLFAFILSDHTPGAVIVNRRALSGIPYERNDRESPIVRAVKQILCIWLCQDGLQIASVKRSLTNQITEVR